MAGCGCTGATPCESPSRRPNAVTGRYSVDRWPADQPAEAGRRFERNYDVQAFTGYPVSTVRAGQWARGVLYRQAMPALQLSQPALPMYDPTDPRTWPDPGSWQPN